MNMIEQIKERLAYFPSELRDGGFSDNSLAFGAKLDIEYLLSKLEIAEQFIKAVEIVSRIKEYEDLNKMSIDAIQQIRA